MNIVHDLTETKLPSLFSLLQYLVQFAHHFLRALCVLPLLLFLKNAVLVDELTDREHREELRLNPLPICSMQFPCLLKHLRFVLIPEVFLGRLLLLLQIHTSVEALARVSASDFACYVLPVDALLLANSLQTSV